MDEEDDQPDLRPKWELFSSYDEKLRKQQREHLESGLLWCHVCTMPIVSEYHTKYDEFVRKTIEMGKLRKRKNLPRCAMCAPLSESVMEFPDDEFILTCGACLVALLDTGRHDFESNLEILNDLKEENHCDFLEL